MSAKRPPFVVAAVQMRSGDDVERNLAAADRLAAEAARRGARMIAFPENAAYLRAEGTGRPPAGAMGGAIVSRFAAMARRHDAWVLLGSMAEAVPHSRKVFNTSLLLTPRGEVAAVYRKMHLFDVAIAGKARFRESRVVRAGDRTATAATPLGLFGLSICYDLRFPELYRHLALAGAQVLFVPSAFTAYTGRAHWTALLRARAIENLAWVVAPAQWGEHHEGRRSYGHTCVIDPWGRVVAQRPSGTGVVLARIDPSVSDRLRTGLPALSHVREELFAPGR